MKRLIAACVASVLLVLSASHAVAGIVPTTIGVRNGITEFSFALTQTRVNPGPSIIEYQNTGEDPHDLKMKRRGDRRIFSIGELVPGLSARITPRLKRDSRYNLWCSLDGHREAGMEAVIRVRDVRKV